MRSFERCEPTLRGRPKPRKNQTIAGVLVLMVLAVAWLLFGGRSLVKDIQWEAEAPALKQSRANPLAFSPDRKMLVRGGDPVRLYDVASGKLLLTLPTPNDSSSVNCVGLSRNGDVVACTRHSDPYKEPTPTKAEFFNPTTRANLAGLR